MKTEWGQRLGGMTLLLGLVVTALQAFSCFSIRPDGPWDRQRVAMENWREYGFSTLRGQYVDQVAPLTADQIQNPPVFKGHNPMIFYPSYFLTQITRDFALGHLLFCLGSSLWIYLLLTRAFRESGPIPAFIIAASPVTLNGLATLDPVPVSIILTLPVALCLVSSLNRQGGKASTESLLWLLLLLMALPLNWTTVFAVIGCCVSFVFMVFDPHSSYRRWVPISYFTAIAIIGACVVSFSIASKSSEMPDGIGSYFFADTGYGRNATWMGALTRQAVAIIAFNLPLCVLVVAGLLRGKFPSRSCAYACLGAAICYVATLVLLRNYTSHAPGLVAAPIGLAALSFLLLLAPTYRVTLKWAVALLVTATIINAFIFTTLVAAKNMPILELRRFIQTHSDRAERIYVISPPGSFGIRGREPDHLLWLSHLVGRQMYAASDSLPPDALVLSESDRLDAKLIALNTAPDSAFDHWVRNALTRLSMGMSSFRTYRYLHRTDEPQN